MSGHGFVRVRAYRVTAVRRAFAAGDAAAGLLCYGRALLWGGPQGDEAAKVNSQYDLGLLTEEERRQELINLWTECTDKVAEAMEDITQIRSRGVTVIMIEHVMQAIMKISDRIIVLDYGKKIAEGTPAEMAANPKVIEVYLGEECDA